MKRLTRRDLIVMLIIILVGLVSVLFWERFVSIYLIKSGLLKKGEKWAYLKPINRTIKIPLTISNKNIRFSRDGLCFIIPEVEVVSEHEKLDKDYKSILMILKKTNGEEAIIRVEPKTHDKYDLYEIDNSTLEFDPREVNLFESLNELKWHLSLLQLKMILVTKDANVVYRYTDNEVRGFQISESTRKKNKLFVYIGNQNRAFHIELFNLNQDEIDYILSSLKNCSEILK